MRHETPARTRVWSLAVGGGVVLLASTLSWYGLPIPEDPEAKAWAVSSRQSRVVLPAPDKPKEKAWKTVPMSGGPAVYTACVEGDRLFAMNKTAWRGTDGLWPDVALTVAPGACKARVKR